MSSPLVVISHDYDDLEAAERAATVLSRVGLRPWLDLWNAVPGEYREAGFIQALGSAAAVLVLIGAEAPGQTERVSMVSTRISEPSALIPVLLPGAHALPDVLADRSVVDLRNTPVDSVEGAAAILRALLGVLSDDRSERVESSVEPSLDELREAAERVQRIVGTDHSDLLRATAVLAEPRATEQRVQKPEESAAHFERDVLPRRRTTTYEVALSAPALAYMEKLEPRTRAKLAYSLQSELVGGPNDHVRYTFDYSGDHYYTALPLSYNAIVVVFRELTPAELDRLRKERRIKGPMAVGFLVIDFLSPESGIYLPQKI